jgi:hypothetical protein
MPLDPLCMVEHGDMKTTALAAQVSRDCSVGQDSSSGQGSLTLGGTQGCVVRYIHS